jgi:hypothetical protein
MLSALLLLVFVSPAKALTKLRYMTLLIDT